jgi:hypothetical protein
MLEDRIINISALTQALSSKLPKKKEKSAFRRLKSRSKPSIDALRRRLYAVNISDTSQG